jgi:ribonuclease Z
MKRISLSVLTAAALLTAVSVHSGNAQPAAKPDLFRLTLLGTGAPDPSADRFSASTLIEAGNRKILIDAGGVQQYGSVNCGSRWVKSMSCS